MSPRRPGSRSLRLSLTGILLAGLLVPAPARASTIEPMDLRKVASSAPLVVAGTVVALKVIEQKPVYQAIATVRVSAVLRGRTSAEVRIQLRVGLVHFDEPLEVGQSGVFFLQPATADLFEAAYPGSFALFADGSVARP